MVKVFILLVILSYFFLIQLIQELESGMNTRNFPAFVLLANLPHGSAMSPVHLPLRYFPKCTNDSAVLWVLPDEFLPSFFFISQSDATATTVITTSPKCLPGSYHPRHSSKQCTYINSFHPQNTLGSRSYYHPQFINGEIIISQDAA